MSKLSDFEKIKQINEGEHGKIFAVRYQNQIFSLKVIPIDINDQDQNKYLQTEISIMKNMSNISHPNIMKFYNSFLENNNVYLVLEFIEGENLNDLLKKHKGMGQCLKYQNSSPHG